MVGYKEEDIVRESGDLFMLRLSRGVYEIYLSGITHATRKAIISFKGDEATARSKAESIFDGLDAQFS